MSVRTATATQNIPVAFNSHSYLPTTFFHSTSPYRAFRDWLPLANERGGTWFVHLQLQLRFLLMAVELPHMASPKIAASAAPSTATVSAATSTAALSGMARGNANKSSPSLVSADIAGSAGAGSTPKR